MNRRGRYDTLSLDRRSLLTLLGAAAWTLPARADQTRPLIGFLHASSRKDTAKRLSAFQNGLSKAGFVDGQNITIEYRWADGDADRLPEMAADLVRRQVALIATPGSGTAAVAAKAVTASIPIVFATGADPVALGLVASLNHPGGNVTGIISQNVDLAAKRLEVLSEMAPQTKHYFTVVNPTSPLTEPFLDDLQAGAKKLGVNVDILKAGSESEIDAAFAGLPKKSSTALVLSSDALLYGRREQITALAARYAVPAIYDGRDYVDVGGLASYGADFLNVMQLAGNYVGRILKGEKPADLPVMRSEKFELVINLKTAKALGLTVPDKLLALADEVIE
jgi:putative tryptophan/tyrosine transport system substrate-binding protein